MFNMSSLMEAVDTGRMYRGGNLGGFDSHPGLSLTECISGLSMCIMESRIEQLNDEQHTNELMMEATVNAMNGYGTSTAFEPIIEGAWDSFKRKVKEFFAKAKKWIQSIIAKLKLQIDKIFMNGNKLWNTYKDKIDSASKENLTFNGYKTEGGEAANIIKAIKDAKLSSSKGASFEYVEKIAKDVGASISPMELVGEIREELTSFSKMANSGDETSQKRLEEGRKDTSALRGNKFAKAINDLSESDLDTKLVSVMFPGLDPSSEQWSNSYSTQLYPAKQDIKWGSDMFTKEGMARYLSTANPLSDVKAMYENFLSQVNEDETDLENAATKAGELIDKDNAGYGKDGKGKTFGNQLKAAATAYFNAYVKILGRVYNVANKAFSILSSYYKTMTSQAKSMLGKVLSNKPVKKAESADEYGEFDFAW